MENVPLTSNAQEEFPAEREAFAKAISSLEERYYNRTNKWSGQFWEVILLKMNLKYIYH